MASSDYNTEVHRDSNGLHNSWVVHEEPERRPSQWVFVVVAVAVICLVAWFLQKLWEPSSVVEAPPAAIQSAVPEPRSDDSVPSDPSVAAEEPLVSLLDEWPGIAGALILRGLPLTG